jgi:HD superfamily phosphohydrolase
VESDSTFKIIRDPIHDIIRIREHFTLRLLDTAPMQRLRRVRQLGMACLVFPGAEHSRFTHVLGVYHLAGRVLSQLREESQREGRADQLFTPEQHNAVLAAALLHDLGHGPFSHVFELAFKDLTHLGIKRKKHSEWSIQIVQDHSVIRATLRGLGSEVPDLVVDILRGIAQPGYVQAIVDSQLDVDRFDYLLRDAHMTGTRYGQFDLEWMLRTMTVRKVQPRDVDGVPGGIMETIVVDGRRGLSDLERYVLGRHHTYRNVYYHRAVRSAERMLRAVLTRSVVLIRDAGRPLGNAAWQRLARGDELSIGDYLALDDFRLLSWIADWAEDADSILSDLAGRLTSRRLFKIATSVSEDADEFERIDSELRSMARSAGFNPDYYILVDEPSDVAYKREDGDIWYVNREGVPAVLSEAPESIVAQYLRHMQFEEHRWVIPSELVDRARGIQGVLVRTDNTTGGADGDA